jgi:hypothetical protein
VRFRKVYTLCRVYLNSLTLDSSAINYEFKGIVVKGPYRSLILSYHHLKGLEKTAKILFEIAGHYDDIRNQDFPNINCSQLHSHAWSNESG